MASSKTAPPSTADVLGPPERLNFLHSLSRDLPEPVTPIEAWDLIMAEPMPLLALAFRVRDAISVRFGVKSTGGFSGARTGPPVVGEYLDFFLVERADPGVLTLTARDVHLDVMTCLTTEDRTLAITTSVITHRTFGRVYMMPVAPAHKLIVRGMLNRVERSLRS